MVVVEEPLDFVGLVWHVVDDHMGDTQKHSCDIVHLHSAGVPGSSENMVHFLWVGNVELMRSCCAESFDIVGTDDIHYWLLQTPDVDVLEDKRQPV